MTDAHNDPVSSQQSLGEQCSASTVLPSQELDPRSYSPAVGRTGAPYNMPKVNRVSSLTSQLLAQEPSGDEDAYDDAEDDPLNVRAIATAFDGLMTEINTKTETLASKVYAHVDAKKHNCDVNIEEINARISQVRVLLKESEDLNMEIEKLDQLRLFTRDFNERLQNVSRSIKQASTYASTRRR